VQDAAVLSVLGRADAAAVLPRLGGMARPDGVFIASDHSWAFSSRAGNLADGGLARTSGRLARVPLVRGLLRLAAALAPVFRLGRKAGRREAPVFAAALGLPVVFALLPESVATAASIVAGCCFVVWLFRGRTLFLHGAEHRAIAAAETRTLLATWHGAAHPSRFALRCGTNFAVLALPIAFAFQVWWPFRAAVYTPIVLTALSLGLAMEVWQAVQAAPRVLARFILAPGLALQRLTTQEPTLEETRVALRAVCAVLVREQPALAER
jgi:Protein of unknown function (DUF1385)